LFFLSAKEFLGMLFYALMFPKALKKYSFLRMSKGNQDGKAYEK